MKYIRTKDGIFEDKYVHIKVDKDGYTIMEYKGDFYEPPTKVKTADTIKELCDDFVVAYEDGARIVYGDLEWAKTKAKASLEFGNKSVIYGAIWTDKGLIYVAKMNEKGELELI